MPRSGRRRSTTTAVPPQGQRTAPATARDASTLPRPAAAAHAAEPRDIDPMLAKRAIVEHLQPQIDDGQFPVKRVVGDIVEVEADVFADGHDVLVAVLRDRPAGDDAEAPWREARMALVAPGSDRWRASFAVERPGWHEFTVVAWVDPFLTWRRELQLKAAAGQAVELELLEGALLVREAAARAAQFEPTAGDAAWLEAQSDALCGETPVDDRVALANTQPLAARMFDFADRRPATTARTLRVWVDRERARTGAWYELFPRSAGPDAGRSATFAEAATQLPRVAAMGFDVLYLPPIHPIGRSFRKGPDNSLNAGPDDPGSPWAIGSGAGGHTAVEPGLGTLDDFDAFHAAAQQLGLELALDLAWQCSPDHPWVSEHPEWFRHRPDGSIKYAENPPKKYQDIYPLDFACDEWRTLWHALLEVTRFWMQRGVRIFRVDNPHTKSFGFWTWLIDQAHRETPDVVFLAEAFTRPKPMRYLARAGFSQSYTYFTWRNTRAELTQFVAEFFDAETREYLRPNLFANTPDILHAYLQTGGRPAFEARLVLAATLSASYGIYSGYELCEHVAVSPRSEEYLHSEKYQVVHRNWDAPGQLTDLITRLNAIRREHPALQWNGGLEVCDTDNDQLFAYTRRSADGRDALLVVVNLDPHAMQHGHVRVPLAGIGRSASESWSTRDLLHDTSYTWSGEWNYVRLDPGLRQAHVLLLPPHP